jgi:hypothetical protein
MGSANDARVSKATELDWLPADGVDLVIAMVTIPANHVRIEPIDVGLIHACPPNFQSEFWLFAAFLQ